MLNYGWVRHSTSYHDTESLVLEIIYIPWHEKPCLGNRFHRWRPCFHVVPLLSFPFPASPAVPKIIIPVGIMFHYSVSFAYPLTRQALSWIFWLAIHSLSFHYPCEWQVRHNEGFVPKKVLLSMRLVYVWVALTRLSLSWTYTVLNYYHYRDQLPPFC